MTSVINTPQAWSERAGAKTPWDAALYSERGQTQRFLAASRHLQLREGDELLDFGCGHARFSTFVPTFVNYWGFDWSPDMREQARLAYDVPILDELPDTLFDHVVAIGPFNLRDNWSHEQTMQALGRLWVLHTRKTLLVSLFRSQVDRTDMVSYSPEWACGVAERLGCGRFVVNTTYLPNDLLLVMHR